VADGSSKSNVSIRVSGKTDDVNFNWVLEDSEESEFSENDSVGDSGASFTIATIL
jgi:hypothetical protein